MSACPPPIVAAAVWSAVMGRASRSCEPVTGSAFDREPAAQCECTGQCGKHAGARCPHTHGEYRKHGGPVRLVAAPADLAIEGTAAMRLPVEQLLAWCPSCHAAAGKVARHKAAAAAAAALMSAEALF
jgi:hypothetical protein